MPTIEELTADPHPHLARLRASAPVAYVPALSGWLVTSRSAAIAVLQDPATFTVDDPRFSTAQVVGRSMLSTDGDEHTPSPGAVRRRLPATSRRGGPRADDPRPDRPAARAHRGTTGTSGAAGGPRRPARCGGDGRRTRPRRAGRRADRAPARLVPRHRRLRRRRGCWPPGDGSWRGGHGGAAGGAHAVASPIPSRSPTPPCCCSAGSRPLKG